MIIPNEIECNKLKRRKARQERMSGMRVSEGVSRNTWQMSFFGLYRLAHTNTHTPNAHIILLGTSEMGDVDCLCMSDTMADSDRLCANVRARDYVQSAGEGTHKRRGLK